MVCSAAAASPPPFSPSSSGAGVVVVPVSGCVSAASSPPFPPPPPSSSSSPPQPARTSTSAAAARARRWMAFMGRTLLPVVRSAILDAAQVGDARPQALLELLRVPHVHEVAVRRPDGARRELGTAPASGPVADLEAQLGHGHRVGLRAD